jgi:hypothetical protein
MPQGYALLDKQNLVDAAAAPSGETPTWTYPSFSQSTAVGSSPELTATWVPTWENPVGFTKLASGLVVMRGSATVQVTSSAGFVFPSEKWVNTYDTSNLFYDKKFRLFQIPEGFRPKLFYSSGWSGYGWWFMPAATMHPSSGSGSSLLVTPTVLAISNAYDGWWMYVLSTNCEKDDRVWFEGITWMADS